MTSDSIINEAQDTAAEYQDTVQLQDELKWLEARGFGQPEKPKVERTFMGTLGKDITQIPTDVASGAIKGINEMIDVVGDITSLPLPEETFPTFEREDQGPLGAGVSSISQFLAGFGVVSKGLKMLKVGKAATGLGRVAQEAGKGALADVIAFDEQEQRLSNVIQEVPALANPVTDFLEADPDDGVVEGKLKQALEGAGLNLAIDGMVKGLKGMRGLRKLKTEAGELSADELFKMQDEQAADALTTLRGKLDNGLGEETYKLSVKETKKLDPAGVLTGKVSEPDIKINFDRLDGPEEIKNVMETMANDKSLIDSVKAARRGVRTDADLLTAANDIDGFQTLMDRRVGEALSDDQTIAARMLYYNSTKKLMDMAKVASAPDAAPTDVFAFRKMVAVHHAVQKEVLGARAEAARALRAWSINVGENTQVMRELEETMNVYGGVDASQELAANIARLGDRAHTGQINQIVNKAALARTGDAMVEAWTLGLLTNPQTHIVNIGSNALTGMYLGVERAAQSITGSTAPAEAINYFMGYFGSFKDALVSGADAFKTGVVDIGSGTKIDLPFERRTAKAVLDPNNKAGYITDAVNYYGQAIEYASGRVLAAGDAFGKTMLYKAQMRALATREGVSKGLEGAELNKFIAEQITNPTKRMTAESIEFAEYGTFVKPLGKVGQSYQRMVASAPVLRFVSPFIRTPANIFKFTFARTPLALLSKTTREAIAKGGAEGAAARARIGMGSALMMFAVDQAADGRITGAGPNDRKLQQTLRQDGWQPYSIKIGDTYYSYSRFEPLATLLGMGADMAEIMTNYDAYDAQIQDEIEEAYTAIGIVVANQLVGKTFLSGVADTAQMLADPGRYGERYLQRYVGSAVPAGVAAVERAVSPEVEYVKNSLDALKARIPGLSGGVAKRRDAFGDEVVYLSTNEIGEVSAIDRAIGLFNPIYYKKGKNDFVVRNILREGLYIPDAGPNQSLALEYEDLPDDMWDFARSVRINLGDTPEIYDDFKRLRGKLSVPEYDDANYKQALEMLIKGDLPDSYEYNDPMTPAEDKQRILNKISSRYTKEAKKAILEKYPELTVRVLDELEKVKQSTRLIQGEN